MEFRRENPGFWLQGGTSAAMVAQLQREAAEYGLLAGNHPIPLGLGTAVPSRWVKQRRAERPSQLPGCPGRRQLSSTDISSAQLLRDSPARLKMTPSVFLQTSRRICQTD